MWRNIKEIKFSSKLQNKGPFERINKQRKSEIKKQNEVINLGSEHENKNEEIGNFLMYRKQQKSYFYL